jgi:uncharacterized protein YciI
MPRTLFLVTNSPGPAWDRARPREGQDGWREHAAFMNGLAESGFILLGGPVSDREAMHAVAARDEDDVRARLAEDPWVKDGTLVVSSVRRWTILLDAGDEATFRIG